MIEPQNYPAVEADNAIVYSLATAAKKTDKSQKTLRRRIAAGALAAKRDGEKIYIEAAELHRWISSWPAVSAAA